MNKREFPVYILNERKCLPERGFFMKTKLIFTVIALFLLSSSGFSMADETQKINHFVNKEISEPRQTFANHHIEFSLMYNYFDYKEDLPAPKKSTEQGWLPGFYLGLDYNKRDDLYSKIFFEFSFGNLKYDGTTQLGTPIAFTDDNYQFLFRGEWDIGYNFAATKDIAIIPYVGYGYRYWSRGQATVTSTYSSYNEKYYWHYIPVGIRADIDISKKLAIEPNVGLRLMFYGRMTAYFTDLDPKYNDPEFKLGNRIGYYAEIPFKYKLSQVWSVVIKPWYEYSEIGQSDTVPVTYNGALNSYAYEPSSRTHQYGLNVGLVFSY
jgi:hypothetical protein